MRRYARKRREIRPSVPDRPAKSAGPSLQRSERSREVNAILQLQRTIGNQAVQRLLRAQRGGVGGESDVAGPSNRTHGALKLGQPNDRYEQEADRVADHVMRMPLAGKSAPRPRSSAATDHDLSGPIALQAKAESGGSCPSAVKNDDEEPAQMVQAKQQAAGSNPTTEGLSTQLQQSAAGGQTLPSGVRRDMEARFGHPFGQVRVHTDNKAVGAARQLNAEALATGNHIYFNAGRYNPDSFSGKRLLAHELTHVLQQRASREKRVGAMRISNAAPAMLQGYKLKGFPAAKAAKMHSAIATAISTVSSCNYLSWWGKRVIKSALGRLRYDYVPDLGLCGWTFPVSWYVEIGKNAFDHGKCCDLAATLAHEASHTEFYTEGRARKMECKCFGCSC